MRQFLMFAAAALVMIPGSLTAQDPPKDPPTRKKPSDPKAEEREKKAQALWDGALALEKDNKLAEAQAKLRELRSKYRGTWVYLDRMIEISNKISEIGLKLAVSALGKTGMSKKAHQDSWFAYEFVPPQDW